MTVTVYSKETKEVKELLDEMRELQTELSDILKADRDNSKLRESKGEIILTEVEKFMEKLPYDSVDQELLEKIRQYLYS